MNRLTDNALKGIFIVVLFFSLLLHSCQANAQTQPRYVGYEVSMSLPSHRVISNIPQISNMYVSYFGMQVGGVMAIPQVKLKATAGLHYSSANLPYSFDLLSGSLSARVYPLRIKNIRYHTLEPYVVGGIHQYHTKYFGTYLSKDEQINYSRGDEKLLGRTNSTMLMGGVGLEYQLENDSQNFIHFFTEFNYGSAINNSASTYEFENTKFKSSCSIVFGINFGIIKD
jgi:hypothetical protein